jgi:hypothetical protein
MDIFSESSGNWATLAFSDKWYFIIKIPVIYIIKFILKDKILNGDLYV